jgi:hypothetical protein
MHLGAQLALGAHAIEGADQQHADHQLEVDRGAADGAVVGRHDPADERGVEQHVDSAKRMVSRNVVFEAERIEQRLRHHPLAHHRRLHRTRKTSESRPPASRQRRS